MMGRSAILETLRIALVGAVLAVAFPGTGLAQESDADIAKKLANPVAEIVTLPLQLNYDCCYGPEDGERVTLNVQPVVPIKLNDDWNLILRTIVPFISQGETTPGGGNEMGLGDTTQTFFFSPKAKNGLTVAAGPVFYYPTGTGGFSSQKWGAGPSALILKQEGHVTFGLLANHIWSVAGNERSADLSNTLLQPFFNYTFPNSTGILANLESTYDWENKQWTVPMNVGVTHMFSLGHQKVQAGIQGRYYFDKPDGGPDWGVRFVLTYLIPS